MKADCCCQSWAHPDACGCCEGTEALTPLPTRNRPGLSALSYRAGTHATFLETMKARLSNLCLGGEDDCREGKGAYPLAKLTSRAADDFSIGLLDACATISDVLTFYQERIINEGYLRTATERFSVLELARLVGYQPRPGVSSSVYLAYTLDDNLEEEIILPKGARSQSIPGPDEMPQTFETSEDLKARAVWNNLQPRTSQPQVIPFDQALVTNEIYLAGTNTGLKVNDSILLVYGEKAGERIVRRVETTEVDFANDRTKVILQEVPELVYIGVDILRSVLEKLEIDGHSLSGQKQGVENLLTQYSLGKYPPLQRAVFSHERIYRFLKLRAEDEGVGANSSSPSNHLNNDSNPFIKIVIESVSKSIKKEKYRKTIICFFRFLLVQMQPVDTSEFLLLANTVPKIIQELDGYLSDGDLMAALKSLLGSDQSLYSEIKSFITGLEKFKSTDQSREGTNSEGFSSALEKIKSWLDEITEPSTSIPCDLPLSETTNLADLTAPDSPLLKSPVTQVADTLRLSRDTKKAFSSNTRAIPEMLINFQPLLKPVLYQALANAKVVETSVKPDDPNKKATRGTDVEEALPELISVHAMRLSVPLFGHNAPKKMGFKPNEDDETGRIIPIVSIPDGDWKPEDFNEFETRLYLDNAYDSVVEGAYVIVDDNHTGRITAATVDKVTIRPRTAYSISGKTTQIELSKEWWTTVQGFQLLEMASIRETMVYLETEKLALSMAPEMVPVAGQSVDLQGLYGGFPEGRWVIVSGELADVSGTSGVKMAELAMIASVEHISDDWNKLHTQITFDRELAHRFKRDTVTIYGNVVKATHGETRREVLGSGDGAKALQSFVLKQPPLTFVSAASFSGVDSTLRVFVNDIRWQESDTLAGLASTERRFITRTDDDGKTTVVFGSGREGARLPTGIENIKAEYRSGIGKAGNVNAEQISMLITRPLGVKEVINPLRASGGADKETRDQARKNVPLAVKALDRLVSVQDYEDFTRIYAGIGKAKAVELPDGRRQRVHITIAGIDDMPIEASSDLYRNLYQALLDCSDPYQAIQLEVRELMLIVISANIRILPDYQWEPVVTEVRTTLLDAFSFERRELGQDVLLSELISVMQAVPGVAYVDVDTLRGVPEKILDKGQRRLLTPAEIADCVTGPLKDAQEKVICPARAEPLSRLVVNLAGNDSGALIPAQLAFLTPGVPETLILNQII